MERKEIEEAANMNVQTDPQKKVLQARLLDARTYQYHYSAAIRKLRDGHGFFHGILFSNSVTPAKHLDEPGEDKWIVEQLK